MSRIWKAGGKELRDNQIPFAYGTDNYYRYVAEWRAKANGIDYSTPNPHGVDGGPWREDLQAARDKYYGETRAMDHGGQQAQHYVQAMDPMTGMQRSIYDANGNGAADPGELGGVYGGAGNLNPAKSADNRWNELDGADPRTDEQKFYDRDIDSKSYKQVADAQGTYNWYGTENYTTEQGEAKTRDINLDVIGTRAYDGKVDAEGYPSKQPAFNRQAYSNYNDAPDKNYFDDQIRKRANLSVYGRTA